LTSPSLEALFDWSVRKIKGILKADFCEVLEYAPQTQTLLLRAGAGWKRGLVRKAQLEAGKEWEPGYALSRDRPVIVDDLTLEKRFRGSPLLIEQGQERDQRYHQRHRATLWSAQCSQRNSRFSIQRMFIS
jgi:GAF domain-containing protein